LPGPIARSPPRSTRKVSRAAAKLVAHPIRPGKPVGAMLTDSEGVSKRPTER
jgi:hypothetical protein